MKTKLTLRIEERLIKKAKSEAERRGKSVSTMVAEYVEALEFSSEEMNAIPPTTASLVGVLKGSKLSEKDYKRHLEEKHR
jgi:hypothetical protein